MAVGSYPNSLSTASVCSPSVGPPSSKSPGMAESFGTAPGSDHATGPYLNSRFLRILWLIRSTPADSFGSFTPIRTEAPAGGSTAYS